MQNLQEQLNSILKEISQTELQNTKLKILTFKKVTSDGYSFKSFENEIWYPYNEDTPKPTFIMELLPDKIPLTFPDGPKEIATEMESNINFNSEIYKTLSSDAIYTETDLKHIFSAPLKNIVNSLLEHANEDYKKRNKTTKEQFLFLVHKNEFSYGFSLELKKKGNNINIWIYFRYNILERRN